MASKTNPTSLRLGGVQAHTSNYYSKESLGACISSDQTIMMHIEAFLKALQCLPGPISIQRTPGKITIDVLYAKNPLFEDSRPKNRKKNRMIARLPELNKETNQGCARTFDLQVQNAKLFWAQKAFQTKNTEQCLKTSLLLVSRKNRVLLSLLLDKSVKEDAQPTLGSKYSKEKALLQELDSEYKFVSQKYIKTFTPCVHRFKSIHSSFLQSYAHLKVMTALGLLGNAEQSRLSLGFRAVQSSLHPQLGLRKSPALLKIVTPSSTLSSTHLFGYVNVAKSGYPSLRKETDFNVVLGSVLVKNKINQNRLNWLQKVKHCPEESSFKSLFPSVLKTGLEGKLGNPSLWKGTGMSSQKKSDSSQSSPKSLPFLHETIGKKKSSSVHSKIPQLSTGIMESSVHSSVSTWPLTQAYGGVYSRVFKQGLEHLTNQPVDLRFHKAKDLLSHPTLLAQGIAMAFTQRVSPRAILSKVQTMYRKHSEGLHVESEYVWKSEDVLLRGKLKGLRLKFSGPLGKQGGGKKKTIVKKLGSTPLNTLDAQIGYAQTVSHTKRGAVGIKVYIHYAPVHQTKSGIPGWSLSAFQGVQPKIWKDLPVQSFLPKKSNPYF
jgi:ribosomal protein S3